MGKRLILSEEEKQRIKGLYVDIISEQSEMKGEGPTSIRNAEDTAEKILDSQNKYNDGSFWFYEKGDDVGLQVQFTGEVAEEGDRLGKPTLKLSAKLNPYSKLDLEYGTVEFVCLEGNTQASLIFGELNPIVTSNNYGEPGTPEYIVYENFCKK